MPILPRTHWLVTCQHRHPRKCTCTYRIKAKSSSSKRGLTNQKRSKHPDAYAHDQTSRSVKTGDSGALWPFSTEPYWPPRAAHPGCMKKLSVTLNGLLAKQTREKCRSRGNLQLEPVRLSPTAVWEELADLEEIVTQGRREFLSSRTALSSGLQDDARPVGISPKTTCPKSVTSTLRYWSPALRPSAISQTATE